MPSEFRGRICRKPEGVVTWGVRGRDLPVPRPRPHPPQADGLDPLHGAHVKDVHAVLAVHRDVRRAATWHRGAKWGERAAPPPPVRWGQWGLGVDTCPSHSTKPPTKCQAGTTQRSHASPSLP